ncbi:MAG: xanthine dehydrogenase molybdenum-binding subunit XdhA [Peptococcales bacterium]|jgi:xanthine dehydrogenase molybdenum-binding subunit
MEFSVIGKSVRRLDAVAKVTGKAKFTGDFFERDMLVGKVLRSPYAHAKIKSIDISKAKALPGVEAVLTYENVSQHKYPTAGHPYALDPEKSDVADRTILANKARYVGDEIAAVIAVDELTAEAALKLIEVEYEVLEPLLTPEDAMKEGAPLIHEDRKDNIVSSVGFEIGDVAEAFQECEHIFEDEFETSIVQHCHMEPHVSYAYIDSNDRIVIVSSTQIPHIARRIVGQALGLPWGKIRIIKPYIGGGFGNKQEVILEPIVAAMTLAVGGRPVKLEHSREESMIGSRTRHAFKFKLKTGVNKEGKLIAAHIKLISNTGAYASHGHSIAMSAGSKFRALYNFKAIKFEPITVYTNLPVAGAMRGYGAPQIHYALECHLENIARQLNLDPIEFRKQNFAGVGYEDPLTGLKTLTNGIAECVERGKELINWSAKQSKYTQQKGFKRRGLGMACFAYLSGTHPVSIEIAGARIVLNQDGSVQLQIGATEIGQGSDTVFAQIIAEAIGIKYDDVHVISTQDTDISPFDTGSYASRQTYVTGMAVKKAADEVKAKILDFAWGMTDIPAQALDIKDSNIIYKHSGQIIMPLEEVAMRTYYDTVHARPITSDTSNNARANAPSFGVTFAEVEVDLQTGKIDIVEIYNIHDAGKIINPQLAEGQVHGGVSMGIGYALSEQLLFNEKTGKPLNNNLLDYKLPTIMDTPEIGVDFVETYEPTSAYGVKSLGEPPTISPAPAIRNAVLDATGVEFNSIPMNPQKVFEKFKEAGLI